jgi:flagellar biogenesis protein FliO
MLLSLSVVLGLLWVIARVGRGRQVGRRPGRTGGGGSAASTRIEMLGRRALGRHSAVFVVRAGSRTLVLGQTPQQITVLAECDPDQPDRPAVDAEAGNVGDAGDMMPGLASENGALTPKAWDAFVDRLREMTVRH